LETPDEAWVTAKGYGIIEDKPIHIQIQPKDAVIMQCTGLKDVKGRYIYEDDIISGPFATGMYGKYVKTRHLTAVVRWSEHQAGWLIYPGSTGDYRFYPNFNECEVIGNVHSNSDLLR
jgi:uncharacterized phage protein (TIGR01671 family)